jgi:hypothetical protein
MGEMKPWPVKPPEWRICGYRDGGRPIHAHIGSFEEYERARAEAAIERLRVAVAALEAIRGHAMVGDGTHTERLSASIRRCDQALSAIGDIPKGEK